MYRNNPLHREEPPYGDTMAYKLCHGIIVLLGAAGLMLAAQSSTQPELRVTSDQPEDSPEDVTLAVLDISGDHIGSAVSIQTSGDLHWAVTNKHVVGDMISVCLADRKGVSYSFNVIQTSTEKNHENKPDIAFLWAPIASTKGLPIASWQDAPSINPETLPIVEAIGYPTSLQSKGKKPELSKARGLVLPLLNGELEEGFDLTYTAQVQKGMSGGGVFANQRLVAINGAHSDPLWPVEWRNKLGKPVKEVLNMKLALVSIGISTRVISRELKNAQNEMNRIKNTLPVEECK